MSGRRRRVQRQRMSLSGCIETSSPGPIRAHGQPVTTKPASWRQGPASHRQLAVGAGEGRTQTIVFADPLRLQAQPGFAAQIAASARNTRKGQDTGLIGINALSESARRLRAQAAGRKLAVHTERVLGDVSQSKAVLEHLAELLGAELAWGEADLVKHPPEPVLRMSVVGALRG